MVQKLKKPKTKTVVGVTGSFGSGKSTVSKFLETLGAGRMDADEIVHRALSRKGPVYEQVRKLFGGMSGRGKKGLDRKKIAAIVFKDPGKRKKLEAVLHPYVFETILAEVPEMKQAVVVLDVPLLFETGFHRYCHKTIAVQASPAVIRKRLFNRGVPLKDIAIRSKAQMPLSQKVKRADFVVRNNSSLSHTHSQIKKIWKEICS